MPPRVSAPEWLGDLLGIGEVPVGAEPVREVAVGWGGLWATWPSASGQTPVERARGADPSSAAGGWKEAPLLVTMSRVADPGTLKPRAGLREPVLVAAAVPGVRLAGFRIRPPGFKQVLLPASFAK